MSFLPYQVINGGWFRTASGAGSVNTKDVSLLIASVNSQVLKVALPVTMYSRASYTYSFTATLSSGSGTLKFGEALNSDSAIHTEHESFSTTTTVSGTFNPTYDEYQYLQFYMASGTAYWEITNFTITCNENLKPRQIDISPRTTVATSHSQISGVKQFVSWPNQGWDVSFAFPEGMSDNAFLIWKQFLTRQMMKPTPIQYIPDFAATTVATGGTGFSSPRDTSAASDIYSNEITFAFGGGNANVTNLLGQGSFLSINGNLYTTINRGDTDGSGDMTLELFPHLLSDVELADSIEFSYPSGTFYLNGFNSTFSFLPSIKKINNFTISSVPV